jgi:hypothetical protein
MNSIKKRCLTFAPAIKNIIKETGTTTSIVQKSGWAPTSITTTHITSIKGIKPSENVWRNALYCLKKYAKYTIRENFKNSVGCIANGRKGTLIHHFAPFQLGPITRTTISKTIEKSRIYFAYFSKYL